MDVTKMSGEQIATIISGEYQKLITADANIKTLNAELSRREQIVPKEEETKGA